MKKRLTRFVVTRILKPRLEARDSRPGRQIELRKKREDVAKRLALDSLRGVGRNTSTTRGHLPPSDAASERGREKLQFSRKR